MHFSKAFRESLLEFVKDVRTALPRLAEDAFKFEMALTPKKVGRKKGWRQNPIPFNKPVDKPL